MHLKEPRALQPGLEVAIAEGAGSGRAAQTLPVQGPLVLMV